MISAERGPKWTLFSLIYFGITGILWFILTFSGDRYGYGIATQTYALGAVVGTLLLLSMFLGYISLILSIFYFFKKREAKYVAFLLFTTIIIFASFIPGPPEATLARGEGSGGNYPITAEITFAILYIIIAIFSALLYINKVNFLNKQMPLKEPWRSILFILIIWLMVFSLDAAQTWERGGSDDVRINPTFPIYMAFALPGSATCSALIETPSYITMWTCGKYLIPLMGLLSAVIIGLIVGTIISKRN